MSIPIQYIIDAQWKGSAATRKASTDLRALDRNAKNSTSGVKDFNKSLGGLDSAVSGLVLGGGLAVAGSYLLDFGRQAVDAASDIEETTSLIDNSLGDSAQRFREELDLISEATGRSAAQLEIGASTIVAMTRSMGLGQQSAAEYSASFAQVALDLGSFFNQEPEQVFEDIQGALAGSSETLQKYGIDVRETTLQQAALNAGIIEQGESLTRVQRAYILQQEVIRQTADAQGDAARTSESYANQVRRLQDEFFELKVVLGDELLPVITEVVSALGSLTGDVADDINLTSLGFEAVQKGVLTWREYGDIIARTSNLLQDNSLYLERADAIELINNKLNELSDRQANDPFALITGNIEEQIRAGEQAIEIEELRAAAAGETAERLAYQALVAQDLAVNNENLAVSHEDIAAAAERRAELDEEAALAAERLAAAQRDQAQALAGSFTQAGSLYGELAAAQDELANAQGAKAEEARDRVVAANEAIAESYRNAAFEGLLASADSVEELSRNIAAAVDAGFLSAEEAAERLDFAENIQAIDELEEALNLGNVNPEQYGEIFNAITTGVADSVEEAKQILGELDESFLTLGDEIEPYEPQVDPEPAFEVIDGLATSLTEFTEAEYLALLQADPDPALEILETLRTDMTTYDDTVYEAILDAEDAAAQAALNDLNSKLSALDGRTVTVNVAVNQTSSGTGQAIPGFARGVQGFRVPSGFPNDSYLIGVTSGEVVDVRTPAQQRQSGGSGGSGGGNITYNIQNNYQTREAAAIGGMVEIERERRINSYMDA